MECTWRRGGLRQPFQQRMEEPLREWFGHGFGECIKSPLPLGRGLGKGETRASLDVSPSPQPSPLKGEGVLNHAHMVIPQPAPGRT